MSAGTPNGVGRNGAAITLVAALWLAAMLAGCGPPRRPYLPVAPKRPAPVAQPVVPPPTQAPSAAPDMGAMLFPHADGDTRDMRVMAGGETHTLTARTTDVKEAAGVVRYRVEWQQDGQPSQVETYTVTPVGVYCEAVGAKGATHYKPPLLMLPLPYQPDASWTWKGTLSDPSGSAPAAAEMKMSGPESVVTPAGAFSAYRIEQKLSLKSAESPQTVTTTLWLAPGAGLIKQSVNDGTDQSVSELTAYKVAGQSAAPAP